MRNSNVWKLISNYGSRLWSMVSVFIFVPFYIKILGIESYAVIGFYTLILGVISFADSGLSSAVVKEFSKEVAPSYKYSIFRNIENVYVLICCIIAFIIFCLSGLISQRWLTSAAIDTQSLSYYISLIGVGASLQLLSSLYYGALFGLGNQVQANFYQILWNIFRAGIVILILLVSKATLEIYFIWQIVCNLIYILILRYCSITVLKEQDVGVHNYLSKIPTNIISYVGGMTIIAFISALNSQADKLITSSLFPLKTFGYYNIVSILSQIPVMFGTPLVMFAFPIFSKLAVSNSSKTNVAFNKIAYLLSILVMPVAISIIVFPAEVLRIWTGKSLSNEVIESLVNVIRFLAIGSFFLSLQLPFFYLLLAHEKTKYTMYQGAVQVLFGIPLIYLFAKKLGIQGVPIPWVLINLGALIYLQIIVFKGYLQTKFRSYFIKDILVPLLINLVIGFMFFLLYKKAGGYAILFIISSGLLSLILSVVADNFLNNRSLNSITYLFDFPK